jgi:endo-1,4-beta-xylanase
MKNLNIRVPILIILFITSFMLWCNKSESKKITGPIEGPTEPTGRRFKTIVKDKYPNDSVIIGGTTGAWALGTYTGIILDREFSYVTPENDFKQWNIHPDNTDRWNWTETDAWIDHIAKIGQILRMHCPIGPQCSNWAKDDSRTAAELETNLRAFMEAVCKRYNGTPGVVSMDVVNEVLINGQWHQPKPGTDSWENPWYTIGLDNDTNKTPLFIKMAFDIATQHAPDLKLIFNHHEAPTSQTSWNKIKETVYYLRNRGLRVDGIGWQAHVDNGWANFPSQLSLLDDLIDWAHANDLEFHITEASVWLKNGVSPEILQQQGQTYAKILNVLLNRHTSGKIGWNIWHIDDGHGWQTEFYPSLFDTAYTAKPAYYAVQQMLEEGGNN